MLKKQQQQNNKIDTKSPNVFNNWNSLREEAKDLIDEIEDANDYNDDGKLLFIGNKKDKFNFNTFKKPLNFLSALYNGEISLKKAEINQRNLEKKIEELKCNFNQKNEKEKKEINELLMQANDLLEYRNEIIDASKNDIVLSRHLKT